MKFISMLLIRRTILQNPLIIKNNNIWNCSKSFPFPSEYNYKLCTSNRFFCDKKAEPPKPAAKKPDAKPAAKKPDPKPAAKKPDPKAAAKKPAPKAAANKPAAKKPPPKPKKVDKPEIDKKAVARMAKLQAAFQKDDGKPVFLKMGFRDMILYRATCGLALVGLVGCVLLYLSLIFK